MTCRRKGDFIDVPPTEVDYMDVSPKQLVSVAAAIIPFLEHDDANRASWAQTQRQAVRCSRRGAFVATGMEGHAGFLRRGQNRGERQGRSVPSIVITRTAKCRGNASSHVRSGHVGSKCEFSAPASPVNQTAHQSRRHREGRR